jgi:hypothetical protein
LYGAVGYQQRGNFRHYPEQKQIPSFPVGIQVPIEIEGMGEERRERKGRRERCSDDKRKALREAFLVKIMSNFQIQHAYHDQCKAGTPISGQHPE